MAIKAFTRVAAGMAVAVALTMISPISPAGAITAPPAPHLVATSGLATATTIAKPVVALTLARKAYAGDTISISTKGTVIPAGVKKIVLSFGDKTASKTLTKLPATPVKHRFTKVGTFTVKITITDKTGHVFSKAQKIVLVRKTTKHSMGAVKPTAGKALAAPLPRATAWPASANLLAWAMPVESQGNIGSCTTWAVNYGLMGWYAKRANWAVTKFAPMYSYSQLVKGDKTQGTRASDVLNIAMKGVDSASHYPGWKTDYTTQPTAAQRSNATKYRIASWHQVINPSSSGTQKVAAVKAQLSAGYPMVIGMQIYESFNSYQGGYYSHTSSGYVGGHEMLVLGYDAKGILVQNSWGTTSNWGTKTVAFGKRVPGYAWISWATVAKDVNDGDVISGLVQQRTTDTTAPKATAPVQRLITNGSTSNGVPVQISWSGSDNSGRVASYDLWASTNGGAWTQQALNPVNSTSITFALRSGNRYEFAVRSRDGAGNVSAWQYGPSFAVATFPENNSYVHYHGTGWRYVPWAPAQGGQEAVNATSGDWVSFTFTGRNVAWVSAMGPNQGQAYVYMDGEYQFTRDLYSATSAAQRLVVTGNYTSSATHTLAIEVVGTAGRPTVAVDSFVILG